MAHNPTLPNIAPPSPHDMEQLHNAVQQARTVVAHLNEFARMLPIEHTHWDSPLPFSDLVQTLFVCRQELVDFTVWAEQQQVTPTRQWEAGQLSPDAETVFEEEFDPNDSGLLYQRDKESQHHTREV